MSRLIWRSLEHLGGHPILRVLDWKDSQFKLTQITAVSWSMTSMRRHKLVFLRLVMSLAVHSLRLLQSARDAPLADRLFDQRDVAVNYDLIPTAVFTTPPIGTVGLSESEAFDRFGRSGRGIRDPFRGTQILVYLKRRDSPNLYETHPAQRNGPSSGVHIAGDDAAEMIQGFAVALTAGATKSQFDETLAIHPTSAEELVLLKEGRPAAAP